jgi:hypothetical protein
LGRSFGGNLMCLNFVDKVPFVVFKLAADSRDG